MNIRSYLTQAAQQITDRAVAEYTDAAAWQELAPQRRRQFLDMMGLAELPPYGERPPLNVTVTGVVERPAYRIEKLYYESLPQLYVTANLYVPNNLTGPAPGVLYACGHSQKQKWHYQAHPRRFAELGFVCLIYETIHWGEVNGYHHGPYREGWFHWYSRGYAPGGIEMLNGIRGLDLLAQRPEVDSARLGMTGISGGGASTWWVAAGDERVQVAAPVCATGTLASHIKDRTIDGHCDCMWWNNAYQWDLADVGALIAPRPLMIASADRDDIYRIDAIRQVHAQLEPLYKVLGAADKLRLVETPGPHSYHERSRTAIFSWFIQHLQGRAVSPAQVGDIDATGARPEAEETLRVYSDGGPAGNLSPTVHDAVFAPPPAPQIEDETALVQVRQETREALAELTFGAFPVDAPSLNLKIEREAGASDVYGLAFTTEAGLRLRCQVLLGDAAGPPAPAVIALGNVDEPYSAARSFVQTIQAPWVKVVLETRGTINWKDEPPHRLHRLRNMVQRGSQAEKLQWHLRRAAAWTGRTLASMRVWDTLRALEAVRSLPEVEGEQIALAARGEMCAVALYAALLDGDIATLFLEDPPATQNAPGQPDGNGPALEMLNCLRITDLPQVAGLLYPTELVFTSGCPATYQWAEDLYARLGTPEKFCRAGSLTQ